MRKKEIIIFSAILILSNIFVSFLDICPHNVYLQNNSSNIKIENKDRFYPSLLKNSDLALSEGNYTKIRINSISNPGGELEAEGSYYISFIGSNLSIRFRLHDMNNSGNRVLDEENQATFSISYNKTSGLNQIGPLINFISFDNNSQSFNGIIETSTLIEPGNYSIKINADLLGYEIEPRKFHIRLLERFKLNISFTKPNQLNAGEKLELKITAGYIYKSTFFPLKSVYIILKLYLNNNSSSYIFSRRTNSDGKIGLTFILPLKSKALSFDVVIYETFYYESVNLVDIKIEVIPYLEIVKYLSFYLGIVISSMIIMILIFYKLVISKKRKKKRILIEFKQTFEDILKLDHVFILFKVSREPILNKSYTSEKTNDKMLNEFKSFISSFNNFNNSQNSINEINYKNKILLMAEGKFLIIGIILKNKISDFFKNKLNEFLNYIEILYKNEFLSNNIPSNSFKKIESIFENKLNVSIISPHRIEPGKFDTSLLTKSSSINIYSIMNDMVKEEKKNSFYLSDIFSKFSKQTEKGIVEFLMGITELKNTSRIMPIKNNI